jgi:hypothetical protein
MFKRKLESLDFYNANNFDVSGNHIIIYFIIYYYFSIFSLLLFHFFTFFNKTND